MPPLKHVTACGRQIFVATGRTIFVWKGGDAWDAVFVVEEIDDRDVMTWHSALGITDLFCAGNALMATVVQPNMETTLWIR
jgi:hypothetical protein